MSWGNPTLFSMVWASPSGSAKPQAPITLSASHYVCVARRSFAYGDNWYLTDMEALAEADTGFLQG
jgi:hypothetical protein